jgi:hypothetical protein
MTQINSHNQGYQSNVSAGPQWGLMKSFYDQRIETPAVNFLYTATPTLINETTIGMNHWDEPGGPLTPADLAKVQRSTYGLGTLGQWYPSANELNYLPGMAFSDVPNAAGFSYDSRTPIHGATTIFTFTDNLTKVYGKHTFKAGVTIMRTRAWKGNQSTTHSTRTMLTGTPYRAFTTRIRKLLRSRARISAPARLRSLCRIRGRLTRGLLWNWGFALPSGARGSSVPISSPASTPARGTRPTHLSFILLA